MIEITKKNFWELLRSRNITPKNIEDDDDKKKNISHLASAIPATWGNQPNTVGIIDVVMMRQGGKKYFWESPDFILDKKLLELFHRRYVSNDEKMDSLHAYFTILSYLYEMCFNSMPSKIKHKLGQRVFESWTNIADAHEDEDTPGVIVPNNKMDELVKKGNINILKLPNWYTSFNFVGYLTQYDDIAAYASEFYDLPGDGSFQNLSCLHYWVMHFEFVYNTFFTQFYGKEQQQEQEQE